MPAKCLAMDGELLAQRKYEPTKKSNVVQQPCWIVRNSSLLVFANNCRRCRALILEFLRLRQWDQRVPCPAVWIVCKNIQTVIFDERIWVLSAAEIWALCIDIASEHLGMWPVFWRVFLSLQFPSGSAIARQIRGRQVCEGIRLPMCRWCTPKPAPISKKIHKPNAYHGCLLREFSSGLDSESLTSWKDGCRDFTGCQFAGQIKLSRVEFDCLIWGMQAPAKADSTVWLWPFDHPTHISST